MFTAKVIKKDLRVPLNEDDVADLKTNLYSNLVLVFPDQQLTLTEFVAFTKQLGETMPSKFRSENVAAYREDFPEILVLDKDYDPIGGTRHEMKRTEGWHADPRVPGKRDEIGILLADNDLIDVAPTQWLDLRKAFSAMSKEQQARLRGQVGIHRNTHSYVNESNEFMRPLVSCHPITAELSLDVHENTLWDIEGMTQGGGREMIDSLFKQIVVDENIYSHSWKKGDLVIWDNLSLIHRRVGSITSSRKLYRIYAHQHESTEMTTEMPRTDLVN